MRTLVVLMVLAVVMVGGQFPDVKGSYCRTRRPVDCCPGRDDSCSVPLLGTFCYCDKFCNRTRSADCCPDFWSHCLGVEPPEPTTGPEPFVQPKCLHQGRKYDVGHTIKINCNQCTCQQLSATKFDFVCRERVCLVRPELIEGINRGYYGWSAGNYSFLWGKTLEEGIRYRLGTFKPSRPTMEMNEIHIVEDLKLPSSFDARQKWPGLIQPVKDQGDCGASWAFSTTALAADRLAIQSKGQEQMTLAPQQLLSCQSKLQKGCHGGHLDRAWWYIRKRGLVTEACYPYRSGLTGQTERCSLPRHAAKQSFVQCQNGVHSSLHKSTPPYRVGPKEEEIMQEIYSNGPVQATFRVREDFYLYRRGVYKYTRLSENLPDEYRQTGYHSVRIIGWGTDTLQGRPVKYWLCTNSWGPQWGEGGNFRILRGADECEIEMFIVGVWAKRNSIRADLHSNVIPNIVSK